MTATWRTRWLAAAATTLAIGCSASGTTQGAPLNGDAVAAAEVTDAASAADAGGTPDAGAPDAGPKDSGPPDTGPTPPACHPVNPAKGPCPAGEHCVWSKDTLICEKDGEHAAGEDCEDGKGCKIGICVKNDSGKSVCAPHCIGNLDCDSNICNGLEGAKGKVCDMGEPPPPQCNPFTQNCSEVGEACYSTPNGYVCKMAGKVATGSPCPEDNSCLKGSICVGKSSASGVCRKICNQVKGSTPNCDVGVKCTPYQGSEFAGYCEE